MTGRSTEDALLVVLLFGFAVYLIDCVVKWFGRR